MEHSLRDTCVWRIKDIIALYKAYYKMTGYWERKMCMIIIDKIKANVSLTPNEQCFIICNT